MRLTRACSLQFCDFPSVLAAALKFFPLLLACGAVWIPGPSLTRWTSAQRPAPQPAGTL